MINRHRGLAVGSDGVFFAFVRVDAQRLIDDVGVELRGAVGDGDIGFFGRPVGELGREAKLGVVGFGDDETAGGVFVEAVDDAGADVVGAGR